MGQKPQHIRTHAHTHIHTFTRRFLRTLDACKQRMQAAGFDPLVFEDALDLLAGQVNAISLGSSGGAHGADASTLLANFRDDTVSNMIVMLLRFVVSAEIQARQEHFAPFVLVRR